MFSTASTYWLTNELVTRCARSTLPADFVQDYMNLTVSIQHLKTGYKTPIGITDSQYRHTPGVIDPKHKNLLIAVLDKETSGLEVNCDPAIEHLLFALPNVKTYTIDGIAFYTQLEQILIDEVKDILDLSTILDPNLSFSTHLDTKITSLTLAEEITKVLSNDHSWVDEVGTIAILPLEKIEAFKALFDKNTSVRCVKTASLYKGTSPFFSFDLQTIANLTTGGRFFLYSTKIKVWKDSQLMLVPFIGLAVFNDNKIFRYSNSIKTLTALQTLTTFQGAVQILHPEKYQELLKNFKPLVDQYSPTNSKIAKTWKNDTLSIVDSKDIKAEEDEKFKVFFINNILKRTPEASKYIAAEANCQAIEITNKELKAQLESITLTSNNNKERVSTAIADIQQLQEEIKMKLAEIESLNADVSRLTPQVLRSEAAALHLKANLLPLRENYNLAISKYWESKIDLSLLDAWRDMGYVVSKIILGKVGTIDKYTTAVQITNAFKSIPLEKLFISELVITTLKPSIIYKDAHRVPRDQAVQHAAGPFIIRITWNTGDASTSPEMSLRLLDDRSIRVITDNGYGEKAVAIHPHADRQGMGTYTKDIDIQKEYQRFTTTHFYTCLGELKPVLFKAMKDLNLSMAIYGLQSWLETADSADQWGAKVKDFPLASTIIIEHFSALLTTVIADIADLKTNYSEQRTYIKHLETETQAFIYLLEGQKVTTYSLTGTTVDDVLTLTPKTSSSLIFITANAMNEYMNSITQTHLDENFILLNTKKNIPEPIFSFSISLSTTEDYSPARKVTEEVIAELMDIFAAVERA